MVKKTENMALEETRSVLHDLEIQKKSIKKQLECGIINSVDASQEEENIMTKERKLKKQLVSAVHVTKDGQPRKIEYKDSKGLYMTILPDKKKIYGKTEEILIDKLFDYYGLAISDVSIAGVFELALAEKQTTQNVNPETIKRDRQTFNRFIISDFGARDIREISKVELRAYTQEMVQRIHPIETAFKAYKGILNLGYAILLSVETGMRVGELCALKWDDVQADAIHIHAQQLMYKENGRNYYYVDWTKDEKGFSQGGRRFPITIEIRNLLSEIKSVQDSLGIKSEYVFCNREGRWIYTKAYSDCLRALCRSLGFQVTNNHAFRMSLNSNVFIPLGIPVTERARLLGHSVETNEKYYSYARKNSMQDICVLLNGQAV